jgi:hypothetical protein
MATRAASCNCGKLSVSYEGPDPQRISLCQCYECQKRTGSVLSVQARIPRDQVTIEGDSTTWTFPEEGKTVDFRSCDSGGATYHFCPACGSTVYWDIPVAPDVIGVAVGGFTDPTFPPPMISGFEAYGHPWAMHPSDLQVPHYDYDGTSHAATERDEREVVAPAPMTEAGCRTTRRGAGRPDEVRGILAATPTLSEPWRTRARVRLPAVARRRVGRPGSSRP